MIKPELQNECLLTGYLSFFCCFTLTYDSTVSVDLGVMRKTMTQPELQNGSLVTRYLSFFGDLNLKLNSTVSMDIGNMTTKV